MIKSTSSALQYAVQEVTASSSSSSPSPLHQKTQIQGTYSTRSELNLKTFESIRQVH